MNRRLLLSALAAPLLILAAGNARAQLGPAQQAPLARVLEASRADITAHSADAAAHFTLGRIHYLALVRGSTEVPVAGEVRAGERPPIAGDAAIAFELYEARQKRATELALHDIGERGPRPSAEKASAFEEARGKRARQLEAQDWHPMDGLPPAERIVHAQAALAAFREAMRLEPRNPRYLLALGLLQEKVTRWLATEKPPGVPETLRKLTPAGARDLCLQAFRLALAGDLELPAAPAGGLGVLVSHQAAEAYVRLAERERSRLKPAEKAALEEVRRGLQRLKQLPIGPIPPP